MNTTDIDQHIAGIQAAQRGEACEVKLRHSCWQAWNTNWNLAAHIDAGNQFRPAPFVLGRSINGFTLEPGQEWHRQDFTREDLPEGWRPVLKGENLVRSEDECKYARLPWEKVRELTKELLEDEWFVRTRRPLPSVIAPGHNPARLSVSQVGEGWRLLDEDEVPLKTLGTLPVEVWSVAHCSWVFAHGDSSTVTYRTRLPREELAALDKPKTRAWNCAQDVPFPWPVVRNKNHPDETARAAIVAISSIGFRHLAGGELQQVRWEQEDKISKLEYSTDGKTFHPCEVPA